MKKYIVLLLAIGVFFGCKKEKKNPEPEPTPAVTPTLPASNFKRVSVLKEYDTITSFKKITTHNYEYSYMSGRLIKETITDSNLVNPNVYISIQTYSYNTSGKIDSYTVTAPSNTVNFTIYKFIYDSITGKIQNQNEVSGSYTSSTTYTSSVSYYHSGNNSTSTVYYGSGGSQINYLDGDITSTSFLFNSQWFTPSQYTYNATLFDKSKQFFNETSFLPAACKLLTSIYHPVGPANPNGPVTITFTYSFDNDGYPVSYENSNGIKYRVYYY